MSDIGGGLDGRLAEGTHMNGTLEFERAVQIDGRFEGSVKSPGKLILGATADVAGCALWVRFADANTPIIAMSCRNFLVAMGGPPYR